jgi:hypothetical protein
MESAGTITSCGAILIRAAGKPVILMLSFCVATGRFMI